MKISFLFQKNNSQEIDEDKVTERIENYAKGLKYHNFEESASVRVLETADFTGHQNHDENDNVVAYSSLEEMKEAYIKFGQQVIEYNERDNVLNGDGENETSVHELFEQELISYYQRNGMTKDNARAKAQETVKRFEAYNEGNLPDEDSDEMELFTRTLAKIGVLDKDGNGSLSANEWAAALMSTAKMNDDKNTITALENIRAEFAIQSQGMTVEEIMQEMGLSREEAENVITFRNKFNNNLSSYQALF